MSQMTTEKKQLTVYSRKNPGVFTVYDRVGLDCACQEDESRGTVYVARGGCVVMECLKCNRLWRFMGMPTHESGPAISATENPNEFDRG